jgi:hypothetical protein
MNKGMRQANAYLRELYLDYTNDYLTIQKFAEHHQIEVDDARRLMNIGEKLHEKHVEMLQLDAEEKQKRKEIKL